MKKTLTYVIALILLFSILLIGYQIYNKPHRDIRGTDSELRISAAALFEAFEENEQAANDRYLDKLIEVSGTVRQVNSEDTQLSILLETGDPHFGVLCQLDHLSEHHRTQFEAGEQLTVKGLCTGKLMDVVLVRCIVF